MKRSRALFAIGVALWLPLCSCATNPVTGKPQLMLYSEQEEIAQGTQSYPLATQMSDGPTPHAEIQSFVSVVGLKMAKSSERPNLPWEFNVVDDNTPNAYSLPGGKVSFTRGLLARLQSEDQVAAVLGHEIGHVTARHAVVAESREAALGSVLGVGSGVLQATGVAGAGVLAQAGQVGMSLITTKYSRDQERQADELGMKYMTAVGYNPHAFLEVMEILQAASQQDPSKFDALFASHPLTSERIETARQHLATQYTAFESRTVTTAAFAEAVRPVKAEVPAFALADEGRKLLAGKQVAAAEKKFESAVSAAPASPILNSLWSDTLYEQGDYTRAEQASARAPGLYTGRLVNGASNWRLHKNREALASLDAAEKLVPGTMLAAYFRGRAFEDLGDSRSAAGEYAKVEQATQGQGELGSYAVSRLKEWGYLN